MRRRGPAKNSHPESGFALLFIYAMAATVAIMLFMELPRVAFEAQRDKEQLLIDRGEQYSRAVNLFVRKFNRFPADFDALQNTQNLRFLRRKYIDPMTGKDDWRIIHVGPGGVFTDSLVYGKAKSGAQQTDQQNFITEIQQTGGNQLAANQNVNIGTRQRQSDQPGAPGDLSNPNATPQPTLSQPAVFQPGLPQTGVPQPAVSQPGLFQPPLPQFDANGQQIPNPQNGSNPALPSQIAPSAGVFTGGFPPGVQTPQGQTFPGGQDPGLQQNQQQSQQLAQQQNQQVGQQFGQQQPGQPPNAPLMGAASLINQILTSPRPGGMNGLGGVQQGLLGAPPPNGASPTSALSAPSPAPAAAQVIGGGIAGVASKYEQDGIKVYKDQTSYDKWEFVYDITKDPARVGGTVPQAAPLPNGATPIPNSFAMPNSTPAPNGSPAPNGTPAPNGFPMPNGAMPPPPPPPPATTQMPVTPQ